MPILRLLPGIELEISKNVQELAWDWPIFEKIDSKFMKIHENDYKQENA